jgi:hypothetical protein
VRLNGGDLKCPPAAFPEFEQLQLTVSELPSVRSGVELALQVHAAIL